MFAHPVVCSSDHQSVWHQDGGFGLLDVRDGHHWDGDLGWTNTGMNTGALHVAQVSCGTRHH